MDLPPDVDYFKVEVREYEDIDSEIKALNDRIKPIQLRIKELKAKKSQLQGNLCEFMSKNKIDECNVSGLDKIPKKRITDLPNFEPPSINLSQLDTPLQDYGSSSVLLPELPKKKPDYDTASIATTAVSSVKLSYGVSKRSKPVTKEFIRGQCMKFFTDAWRSDEFRKLSEGEKGGFLYEYLYNPEDREVIEKPTIKKRVIN